MDHFEKRECRICRSSSELSRQLLPSPCECRGSMSMIHADCLQAWIDSSLRLSCEICGSKYKLTLVRKYSFLHSIVIWLLFVPKYQYQNHALWFLGLLHPILYYIWIWTGILTFVFSFLVPLRFEDIKIGYTISNVSNISSRALYTLKNVQESIHNITILGIIFKLLDFAHIGLVCWDLSAKWYYWWTSNVRIELD